MEEHSPMRQVTSPFGGPADLLQSVSTAHVADLYRQKCNVEILECFNGQPTIELYRCRKTGYRFWRPINVAGDELFYQLLSTSWPDYYRATRWEYPHAQAALRSTSRLLEVGCGRGYFLKSLEGYLPDALGIELNGEAILNRVTRFPVEPMTLEHLCERGDRFDAICAFQVLEHLSDPKSFLQSSLECLSPGGLLILSTPNSDYQPLRDQSDVFDFPPHHMGHFNKAVFRKIADQLGLEMIRLVSQPRLPVFEKATQATSRRAVYKLARGTARLMYKLAYRLCAEPGPNLIAVFRKHAS